MTIAAYAQIILVRLVGLWVTLRLWAEAKYAEAHAYVYSKTHARRGGRRLVYAALGDAPIIPKHTTAPIRFCDAAMVDITPTLAYLFAAHNGQPSIGVVYRHINSTLHIVPAILVVYVCDSSHRLSRAVIDMNADCERLSGTDLSYIDISALPTSHVLDL